MFQKHLVSLFLCAFLLQAFVPAGFMPVFENGRATIEICTSDGIEIISVDADEDSSQNQHSTKSECPYSLANTPYIYDKPLTIATDYGRPLASLYIPVPTEYIFPSLYINAGRAPPLFA